ncbi:hypothetical protein PAECIP111893_01044 [Paenibacillus plantiphilus]|uniref:Uncharacterized protein n=1 Tax=Paenibacillus plantiphilus TaxID=2905650 RepID=A0ABM9C135_9BACL|nr:hypothetical protein PAECIP111893_01044 [Paenibacillus plantiphilus]
MLVWMNPGPLLWRPGFFYSREGEECVVTTLLQALFRNALFHSDGGFQHVLFG